MSQRTYQNQQTPSEMDNAHFALLRDNVTAFWTRIAQTIAPAGGILLDIAPERHGGMKNLVGQGVTVETLDIDPSAGTTYVADICAAENGLPSDRFDVVVCTEVLEHTLDPFAAVATLRRILKPGGVLCLSTPFNFRIHGPLPDCWRFSEHGLRALLKNFTIDELVPLETPGRPLMPIQYTVLARKA